MLIQTDLDEAPDFIRLTLDGVWPSIEEQRQLRRSLVAKGLLTAETCALIDLRMVATVPRYEEVQLIAEAALEEGGLPMYRAYVVGSALQYGVVRQLQSAAGASVTRIGVFSDQTEALVWLMREKRGGAQG